MTLICNESSSIIPEITMDTIVTKKLKIIMDQLDTSDLEQENNDEKFDEMPVTSLIISYQALLSRNENKNNVNF